MKTKEAKYLRIINQITELINPITNPISRMATICAILHHKHSNFFWTGFYLLNSKGELEVSTYQGPLACLKLKKDTGVCWAGINDAKTIIVPDVHKFEGHIACNPLSKSEIVVPLKNKDNIIGIFDIDSDKINAFDNIDAQYLEVIIDLIFSKNQI